ncbi:MAG: hypothetical protein IT326_00175 [Anaerolineae bacterium]|nr:hypothetical protein [Anaerolineae bacterium]
MEEATQFLSLLANLLLVLALPVVIAAAFQHFRAMSKQIADRAGVTGDQRVMIVDAIRTAVQVAEQSGVLDNLLGPEKRQAAIEFAQDYLAKRGVQLNVGQLVDLIESEVRNQFSNPTSPEQIVASRQLLVDKAVEAAVLAAEQSGLKGLIENSGPVKKTYALQFVREYLAQSGVVIDEQIVSGLIEAQLLRLILAAKGQLPSLPTQAVAAPDDIA